MNKNFKIWRNRRLFPFVFLVFFVVKNLPLKKRRKVTLTSTAPLFDRSQVPEQLLAYNLSAPLNVF